MRPATVGRNERLLQAAANAIVQIKERVNGLARAQQIAELLPVEGGLSIADVVMVGVIARFYWFRRRSYRRRRDSRGPR